MFETITTKSNKTFKEINKKHDMICIEDVNAITIASDYNKENFEVKFWINGEEYESNYFETEKEALKFRNDIMGWNNE